MKKCDFVVVVEDHPDIIKDSVGLVEAVDGDYLVVLFIGIKKSLKIHSKCVTKLDVRKTGKSKNTMHVYPKKICNICHLLKKNKYFQSNQNSKDGRSTSRPSCTDCREKIEGVSMTKEARKEFAKKRPKERTLFTCPLCQKTTIAFITANPVRDHDHETGNAREWICDSCNTGLGRFKDDPKLIKRLIKYLEQF